MGRRPPAKGAPDSLPSADDQPSKGWAIPCCSTAAVHKAIAIAGLCGTSRYPWEEPLLAWGGAPMGRQGASLHCDRQGLRPPLAMWGRAPGSRHQATGSDEAAGAPCGPTFQVGGGRRGCHLLAGTPLAWSRLEGGVAKGSRTPHRLLPPDGGRDRYNPQRDPAPWPDVVPMARPAHAFADCPMFPTAVGEGEAAFTPRGARPAQLVGRRGRVIVSSRRNGSYSPAGSSPCAQQLMAIRHGPTLAHPRSGYGGPQPREAFDPPCPADHLVGPVPFGISPLATDPPSLLPEGRGQPSMRAGPSIDRRWRPPGKGADAARCSSGLLGRGGSPRWNGQRFRLHGAGRAHTCCLGEGQLHRAQGTSHTSSGGRIPPFAGGTPAHLEGRSPTPHRRIHGNIDGLGRTGPLRGGSRRAGWCRGYSCHGGLRRPPCEHYPPPERAGSHRRAISRHPPLLMARTAPCVPAAGIAHPHGRGGQP